VLLYYTAHDDFGRKTRFGGNFAAAYIDCRNARRIINNRHPGRPCHHSSPAAAVIHIGRRAPSCARNIIYYNTMWYTQIRRTCTAYTAWRDGATRGGGGKVSGFRKAISLRSFIINSVVFGYRRTRRSRGVSFTRDVRDMHCTHIYVYIYIYPENTTALQHPNRKPRRGTTATVTVLYGSQTDESGWWPWRRDSVNNHRSGTMLKTTREHNT